MTTNVATAELPVFMIHQSFRYMLGRRSYAVSDWIDWVIENWDSLPSNSKNIIQTELEERFNCIDFCSGDDDELIVVNPADNPLGDDVDLANWLRLRKMWQ